MACYARKKAVDKIKLLAVSDFESKFIWDHFDPAVFKGTDLILSCGDLKASYLSYLVTMIPAPLFYVHGNHDGSYLHCPPEGCVDIDGKVVEYKGLRIGGAPDTFMGAGIQTCRKILDSGIEARCLAVSSMNILSIFNSLSLYHFFRENAIIF